MAGYKIMPTPRSLNIAVTGKCNLKCKYCFYADEMASHHDLSTSQWLQFFDNISELGLMDVSLTGGEVFTRKDIFQIIDGIISNRMRYSILTNGTLIDEDLLTAFEKGKRKLRINSIQVSIDGSNADIHNKSRPGSFGRALNGLKLLKKFDFPLTVRVTINRYNVDDLENIAFLLLEEIGIKSFTSNEAMPMGSGCKNADDLALSPQDQIKAMQKIQALLDRYPGRLKANAGPQAKNKFFSEMESAHKEGKLSHDYKMGYLSSCGCIYNHLDILHDGTIVPCHMLSDFVLGNILNDSVQDIWLSHPVLAQMRERQNIPMKQVPGCKSCKWAAYCTGGCPGLTYHLTGKLNVGNPIDCYKRFIKKTGTGVIDVLHGQAAN